MRCLIAPFALALLLAGCAETGTWLPPRSADSIRASGWAVGDDGPPSGIYCYETLADGECFTTPQPARENRLITGGRSE